MASQHGQSYCWLLSRINAMTGSDVGKAELYSMFKELPNGDIQITLNGSTKPIIFPKGKPVKTASSAQLKKGGAPGVEMLMQTVQANRLAAADRPYSSNIRDFSITALDKIANNMDSDIQANIYLLPSHSYSTTSIKCDNYDGLEEALSSFNPKSDMGTITFGAHARTLVDYNPRTKMVTYHNPYHGGVDNTCSLNELKQTHANFAITKPNNSQINTPTSKKEISNSAKATQQTPARKPAAQTPTEQKTNIIRDNFREIAKTADGAPIKAMISGNSVIINKNGNNLEIPLSEIKGNSFYKNPEVSLYCIKETSTNSYIILEADKRGAIRTRSVKNEDEMYKLIDEFDKKAKQKFNSTTPNTSNDTVRAEITPKQPSKTSQTTSGTTEASRTSTVLRQTQSIVQQSTQPKMRVDLPNDKPITRTENAAKYTAAQTQSTPMRKREIPKPTEQKTNIVRDNFREIAKTADGTPINAMISGNSVIINKNGNNLEIPLSEIKTNSFYKNSKVSLYRVKETSTNSYIVIEADRYGTIRTRSVKNEDEIYKLIDEFDNNTKQPGNPSTTQLNSGNISTSNNKPQSQPISTKPARIAVPKGFIVNQEVNGKRTLISTDGKARILMERNNRWMEIDNNGRFRQYNGD